MKKLIPVLLFFFSTFPFFSRAQCPLDCVNPIFGIDISGVFLSQSGNPCVLELQVINNSLQFSVIPSLVVFTNAECTDCPEVESGTIGTWTITTTLPCATPGASYRLSDLVAGICNNTTTCPLTGFALPVELEYFKAHPMASGILLEWKTITELNNTGFELQRSRDGRQWVDLAFIRGEGTSQEEQYYSYVDEQPSPGTNYYRLKQLDYDGQFEFSDIISAAHQESSGDGLRLFPNPAAGRIAIRLGTDYIGRVELGLYDFSGRQVKMERYDLDGKALATDIDLKDLPSGVYLVTLTAGSKRWRERMIIR